MRASLDAMFCEAAIGRSPADARSALGQLRRRLRLSVVIGWPNFLGGGSEQTESKRRPLLDRRRERPLIEIIELAADRDAVREPRHLHVRIVQEVGDVVRRGLAV